MGSRKRGTEYKSFDYLQSGTDYRAFAPDLISGDETVEASA